MKQHLLFTLIISALFLGDCSSLRKKAEKDAKDRGKKEQKDGEGKAGKNAPAKRESERIKDEILTTRKEIRDLEDEMVKIQRKIDEKNYQIRELKGKYKFSLGLEMEKLQKELDSLSHKSESIDSKDSEQTGKLPEGSEKESEIQKDVIAPQADTEPELSNDEFNMDRTDSDSLTKQPDANMVIMCKKECKKIFYACKKGCSQDDKECMNNCAAEAKFCLDACRPDVMKN